MYGVNWLKMNGASGIIWFGNWVEWFIQAGCQVTSIHVILTSLLDILVPKFVLGKPAAWSVSMLARGCRHSLIHRTWIGPADSPSCFQYMTCRPSQVLENLAIPLFAERGDDGMWARRRVSAAQDDKI